MPAVDRIATSFDALRLRLARTPLPAWGRQMSAAALSLLPARWRRLFGQQDQRLCLRRDGAVLALSVTGPDGERALGELPLDDPALLQDLRARIAEAALPAWLLLPGSAVLRRRLGLPAAAAPRLREVLAHELDRQTPFTADQVSFEGRVLSRDPAGQLVQAELLVLPRARLEAELQALGPLAAILDGVDVVEADGHRLGLNLLPATRRERREDPVRRLNAVLAAVAVVALAGALLMSLHNRRETLEGLRQDVAAATAEARQARLARNELQAKAQAANFLAATRAGRPTMLELLDELTRRIPDDTALDKISINGDKVVMIGQSRAAPALVGLLQASPLLSEPALSGAVQADPRTGRDRFTLNAAVAAQTPEAANDGR